MSGKKFEDINNEILSRLDIIVEYEALGVKFDGRVRDNGYAACYARGREESTASAWVSVQTGRYGDKGNGESLSLWDFAVRYGNGQWSNWVDARKHFAEKAGVEIGRGRRPQDPREALEFEQWDSGNDVLAEMWCKKHKPGITLEAVKLNGGRVARWPCYRDRKTKERHIGRYKVVALPAFGHQLLDADPVAWVIWNISGTHFDIPAGPDRPAKQPKMLSVGPTFGAMMGTHALSQMMLNDPRIELIWKTAGPTDMLALFGKIPAEQRDAHLVTCNASSETGDIPPHVAGFFAGRKVFVAHDTDEAGVTGAKKWLYALHGVAAELRNVTLPYEVTKSKGKDVRDFFNGV
jgi:hypothetical protein